MSARVRRAVEGDHVIDVGERRGESRWRLELVDSAEALSAQHQARAVLGQFGKERFVVDAGGSVNSSTRTATCRRCSGGRAACWPIANAT